MTNKLTTGFMGLFLLLVVVDMGLTYYGVQHLGMAEGSFIIGKAGLTSGIIIILALFFFTAFLLWRLRNYRVFKVASITGLALMCGVEITTLTHNLTLII